ncbi:putative pentatricopeptide repeat-containing protein At1g17630 [Curcuma longa]|uniref:putative pentatricopeptide repeat-containing protein At1g17630 n=1 Tax=Curcuma longa TaxID=136217 RepID=UPI003D9F7045
MLLSSKRCFLSAAASTSDPVPSSFDALLRQCSGLLQIKQIHAQLLLSPHQLSPFLAARLISAYTRFGLLADAQVVFEAASDHHATSPLLWNSIIRSTLAHCRGRAAVSLYQRMRSIGTLPDGFTFPLAIRACSALENPLLCLCIHNHAVAMGFQSHLHVANQLISLYGKMGRMGIARKVFDGMPSRNIVTWNTLMSGYSTNCDCEAACDAFQLMESAGHTPNPVTWTTLMSAHARCQQHGKVLDIFNEMRIQGVEATAQAVAVSLSVCPYAATAALQKGKVIHGLAILCGFDKYPFVSNSLVCMYGKLGNREDAKRVFHEMEVRNLVSWNALISSYAAGGLCNEAYEIFIAMEEAGNLTPNVVTWSAVIGGFASNGMPAQSLDLFRKMQGVGVKPNSITLATILSICAELSALRLGKEVHAHIIRGFMIDELLVGNALLGMYAKSGCPRHAHTLFDKMNSKDLISWNTLISGYGMYGLCDEALETFNAMISAGYEPDAITFISILSACSHAVRVSEGCSLFDQMVSKFRIMPSMEHYSCMVDILGRAGLLRQAKELIARMPMKPNACILGAMLNSCRIHGNRVVAKDIEAQIMELEGQATGNYMLLSNLYAANGRWEDSARLRVITKAKGLKKNLGQSWIDLKNKFYVFSAGSLLPQNSKDVFLVLEGLYQQMQMEKPVPDDDLAMLHNVCEGECLAS